MHRPSTRRLGALLAGAAAVVTVACGTSGRELREPDRNAVSPTRSTASTSSLSSSSSAAPVMQLSSSAFAAGGALPTQYSCTGPSPELSWTGVPSGTKEVVLAVVDPDADGFVHWLVTGLPPTDGSVPSGGPLPAGATAQPNSRGAPGWFGPCPPPGQTHTYRFTALALDAPSAVVTGTPPAETYRRLESQAGSNVAVLTATFGR